MGDLGEEGPREWAEEGLGCMEEQAELTPSSFGLEYMCESRVLTEDVGSGIR